MKNVTKKIMNYMSQFKDKDGNEPDMMIIASYVQLYTEAYVKMHRLRRFPDK